MAPRISVIMGVFNCEKYVSQAIDSILGQTYPDFEFIIIDDASTDRTRDILDTYTDKRIILLRNRKNLGLTASLNIGLKKAKGELIARMDADDISMPDRFMEQLESLDKNRQVAVVGTWAHIINSKGKKIGEIAYATNDDEIRKAMIKRSQFIHPSVMFRRSVVKRIGYYDERLRSAQDYDYFARMLSRFKGMNIPKKLLKYRWDFSQNEGFTSGKRQERNALISRWRMIARYGWPWWNSIYLLKPLLSYCIPMALKKVLLKHLSRRKA